MASQTPSSNANSGTQSGAVNGDAPGWAAANLPTPNPNSWQAMLAADLGIPFTPTVNAIFTAWGLSENTASKNNPLAISGLAPGSTTCIAQCGTSSPIMAYGSMQSGVAANAAFIKAGYGIIIQDLQGSTNQDSLKQSLSIAQSVYTNINGSGWCKGCQGGNYPNVLHELISALDPNTANKATVASVLGGGSNVPTTGSSGLDPGAAVPTSFTGIAGNYLSLVNPLGSLLSAITSKAFWTRVGFGFLGFALLVVGVIFLLSQTKTGASAEKGLAMGAVL